MLNRRRLTSLVLLAGWTATIGVLVVPLGRYRQNPTWRRVAWIPFVSRPLTLRDNIRNVMLYVPFGYLHARAGLSRARTVVHATALSSVTESTQIYSRGRYPSTTDVVCNSLGALVGFALARRGGARSEASRQ